ncbi:MamI family restriction endonuclease [Nitrospirales bacterium NOB]|nr:MamI family restriction endonuclease [Nitrospirales bacterium NOB]
MKPKANNTLQRVLELLDLHYSSFYASVPFARDTGHPVPCDTRGWSQILVSLLTGLRGRAREKGTDLIDGSDVKAANTWEAIDTPRFNGVVKAGTKAAHSGKLESLDSAPYLFFVLWDFSPTSARARCRVWCVRPQKDEVFRRMCEDWYDRRASGKIVSANFQLHPPRGKNSNEIRNKCGNLLYPLLFCAEHDESGFFVTEYHPKVMKSGRCKVSSSA